MLTPYVLSTLFFPFDKPKESGQAPALLFFFTNPKIQETTMTITIISLFIGYAVLIAAIAIQTIRLRKSKYLAFKAIDVFATSIMNIKHSINTFNKAYDVQLELTEGKNGYELQYTDPKDEDSETIDDDNKPADTDTPEDK